MHHFEFKKKADASRHRLVVRKKKVSLKSVVDWHFFTKGKNGFENLNKEAHDISCHFPKIM